MKRLHIRVPVEPRLTALDRDIVEAGTTALKRSAIVLERLESMMKRVVGPQAPPERGDPVEDEEEAQSRVSEPGVGGLGRMASILSETSAATNPRRSQFVRIYRLS